tara:strand:- start:8434 stop:8796 length:363 start_codon:yes stop_codon:yes gene_type:complete
MRIRDVFLLEAYFDDLQVVIMDRLAQYLGKEQNEIPTDEFRMKLADDGFMLSFEEMKAAMEQMGVVANIDQDVITPKGKIPNDLAEPEGEVGLPGEEEPVDVAQMAGDQAMSAVKDELPQ